MTKARYTVFAIGLALRPTEHTNAREALREAKDLVARGDCNKATISTLASGEYPDELVTVRWQPETGTSVLRDEWGTPMCRTEALAMLADAARIAAR